MMAEALDDDAIFVYMGGDQEVPDGVRRARIHKSVKIVRRRAFQWRRNLISVKFHDGVEIIEQSAFAGCVLLKSIKLLGVKIIKGWAFLGCESMTAVEFGDRLETIEQCTFQRCRSLKTIRMPTVMTIGRVAFADCTKLSDAEFGDALRKLQDGAFHSCRNLKRIALPLKGDMIGSHVFNHCTKLSKVDLVGGIHLTAASLHMESRGSEMINEINRINQLFPLLAKEKRLQQYSSG